MKNKYLIQNELQAILRVIQIAKAENVDIKTARAMLCDECSYCIYNKGNCVLEEK